MSLPVSRSACVTPAVSTLAAWTRVGCKERVLSAKYRAYAERLTFDYPYVANILERIAEAYDWEAEREDSEVLTRKRLQY